MGYRGTDGRCTTKGSNPLQPSRSATQLHPSYSLAGLPSTRAHHVSQGTVLLEWSSLALVGDCHHRLGRQIAFQSLEQLYNSSMSGWIGGVIFYLFLNSFKFRDV